MRFMPCFPKQNNGVPKVLLTKPRRHIKVVTINVSRLDILAPPWNEQKGGRDSGTQSHDRYNWVNYRVVKGGGPRGGVSLIFPKIPQSSLGILRVPQLPPPLGHPGTLKNPISEVISLQL